MRGRLLLDVCPICSQRNARAMVPRGRCAWCAYVPDPADIESARPVAGPLAGRGVALDPDRDAGPG
ncbi:hypothetical protein [Methylobacterium crusticola]|uniref:hypothetical protein n=1 Tax=Methylobacterium crusticola TaxID=1697972 RepID=UPI0027E2696B|nr:hypothetical protein [Methylobacterium crusticola]